MTPYALMPDLGFFQAALLICYFLTLLFKPERIRIRFLFGLAFLALVIAVVAIPLATSLAATMNLGVSGYTGQPTGFFRMGYGMIFFWLGPILTGISATLAFFSLDPGVPVAVDTKPLRRRRKTEPKEEKHPLDD